MANLDNVRLFVIDSLKKYHQVLSNATDNALSTTLADFVSKDYAATTYLTKADAGTTYVAKEAGKGLSTNDFTTAYMEKLDAIASGAEVNVQSDWSVSDSTSDAFIANKPNIAGLFGYAYYDSSTSKISFSYSSTSGELYSINCSDFIIDGMIDSVSIEDYASEEQAAKGTSYLFIDFNTDAENGGHTDIKIPLKDIFNPSNYYDKTTADSTFVKVGEETGLSVGSNTKSADDGNYTYVMNGVTVSGHQITASYTGVLKSETSLSLGTAQGSGSVVTAISVNGHEITASYTSAFTAADETEISLGVSEAKPASATNRTTVVTDIVASGNKNHTLTVTYANVVTAETTLSLGSVTPDAAGTGYANVLSQLAVSDHTITPTYVKVITEHQSLSDYATKEYVGQTYLTLATAASTYLTHTDAASSYVAKVEGKQLSTNDFTNSYMWKLDGIEDGAEVNAIETITVNNGSALTIDGNRNVNINIPAESTLSLSGAKSADDGDYTYVANEFAVNDHQITVSYVGVLKQHQDISGKEDTSNKKTAIAGNESSDVYYPTTSAVASYVGSLAELTQSELNEIFGISGS